MRYWWVNHKSSSRIELKNGALWAPLAANGGRVLPGHRTMAAVEPDDIVISYADGRARHVGRAADRAGFCVIPKEYGENRWNRAGRILPIHWHEAKTPFLPKLHLSTIRPLLPSTYSPLQENGNANITYLSSIGDELGRYVIEEMGWPEATIPSAAGEVDAHLLSQKVDEAWTSQILADVPETEQLRLAKARTKQGFYRDGLQKIEASCRVTGIADPNLLIASHAKPWSVCDNAERINPYNGLMLAPHVDHLFDRGLIKFMDDGSWAYSPRISAEAINKLGLPQACGSPRAFEKAQIPFLRFHRDFRFKGPIS